jgi:hypothetical protein
MPELALSRSEMRARGRARLAGRTPKLLLVKLGRSAGCLVKMLHWFQRLKGAVK